MHLLCKTTVFGNEVLRLFLETPKLILTFIPSTDIGLKQRLVKKLKQNAGYHKINILAEKAQMIFYAFLKHFSIYCIQIYIRSRPRNDKVFQIDRRPA